MKRSDHLVEDISSVLQVVNLKGFEENENWTSGRHRRVWVNWEALEIVTYCEGDVTHVIYDDSTEFNDAIATATEFYKKY